MDRGYRHKKGREPVGPGPLLVCFLLGGCATDHEAPAFYPSSPWFVLLSQSSYFWPLGMVAPSSDSASSSCLSVTPIASYRSAPNRQVEVRVAPLRSAPSRRVTSRSTSLRSASRCILLTRTTRSARYRCWFCAPQTSGRRTCLHLQHKERRVLEGTRLLRPSAWLLTERSCVPEDRRPRAGHRHRSPVLEHHPWAGARPEQPH